jgi:hypothetical protein
MECLRSTTLTRVMPQSPELRVKGYPRRTKPRLEGTTRRQVPPHHPDVSTYLALTREPPSTSRLANAAPMSYVSFSNWQQGWVRLRVDYVGTRGPLCPLALFWSTRG